MAAPIRACMPELSLLKRCPRFAAVFRALADRIRDSDRQRAMRQPARSRHRRSRAKIDMTTTVLTLAPRGWIADGNRSVSTQSSVQSPDTGGFSAGELAEAARRASEAGKANEAADLLIAALDRHARRSEPVPRGTHQTLAFWLCDLNRLDEAEAVARQGIQKQKKNAELANTLGVILRRRGRF